MRFTIIDSGKEAARHGGLGLAFALVLAATGVEDVLALRLLGALLGGMPPQVALRAFDGLFTVLALAVDGQVAFLVAVGADRKLTRRFHFAA